MYNKYEIAETVHLLMGVQARVENLVRFQVIAILKLTLMHHPQQVITNIILVSSKTTIQIKKHGGLTTACFLHIFTEAVLQLVAKSNSGKRK